MGVALLVGRCLLAGVFLVAGVGKLADLAGSRRAVSEFGVPERLSRAVGVLLPLCELAVAVALIPSGSARFGALGALLLLLAFVIAISLGLASGRRADCHCFGQFHSAPLSWRTLLRNGVLAAVAGLVVLEGWQHPGVSATAWVGDLGGPGAAVLGLGVLLVGLIVFLAWFSLQLLTQNGRIFARLEAIETAIATSEARGVAGRELGLPAALGAGLGGAGLPVGSPAPDFTLRSLQGDLRSLESLLTGGRPLLLIFSDAGCGPCDALLPEVAGWQREFKERLGIALVATGDETRNRQKAEEHRLEHVLLQPEHDVSEAYRAHGTPMALVVGADRRIESPAVGGAEAIRTLVAQATRLGLAARLVPSSNGHRNGTAMPPPSPDTSRVGQPAPELALRDLDGHLLAIKDLYDERTVAVFWNPGCGFCQRMLPDLRALEDDPPQGAPRIIVISGGDPAVVREQGMRSPLLLDPDSEAMRAFAAGGTPMGVLIERALSAKLV
jgi:peroxiredoxin/uncharacterized membrane protein YphA (DoxX/SURF4 family)